jgi:capsular exopolysaccharide synthesis family protein
MRHSFLAEPDSLHAEPFRTLRLAVEARLGRSRATPLLFTSPGARDGKSTVAANYAVVTAFLQRSVLLIDADMRKPRLHELFELPGSPGLVDALNDRLELSEVVHRYPALGGLHVLTAGSPVRRPGDASASAAMRTLLENACEQYEAVVVDAPAVHAAADASSLASHPGTAVVMVVDGAARRRPLVAALGKIALSDGTVLGIVVNRVGTGG